MITRRIIPCLDVRDGKVVKGVQFKNHKIVGSIVDLAKKNMEIGWMVTEIWSERPFKRCQVEMRNLATLQNSWQIWTFDCLNRIQHEKISWFCKKKFQNRMNGVRDMVQWVFTGLPGQNTVHGIMATLQKPYEISKIRFQILIRHEKIC